MFTASEDKAVSTVKPETNVRFLRERAWKSTKWRRALGLPLNPNMVRILLIQGGKSANRIQRASPNEAA